MIERVSESPIKRIAALIEAVKANDLYLHDDNVKAIMVSLVILNEINENHFSFILMDMYENQPTLFINALKKTTEFRYYLDILNGEIKSLDVH
ncbi:hypothetical protein BIT28_23370 [Photobacterium proteolyticum]|uniref:Uncharacterized protein n=1 Tax=Photobacterium proteolyticum TaxID=1903952 RepID=A0A1Q9GM53_9GAMM|nr:hypothetical protein [Photobacterium proteolyticum]OLQ75567.1 hypothetical protein BIT28_23370 [Photobacterium proteolyticum]